MPFTILTIQFEYLTHIQLLQFSNLNVFLVFLIVWHFRYEVVVELVGLFR